ncbi:MAG: TolC family protein [Verrucomicrobiota bacterium]
MPPVLKPLLLVILASSALLVSGCVTATPGERSARERMQQTGARLLLSDARTTPPPPEAGAPLGDYVRYAVLRHPAVIAAWHDWHATVAAIAPARALPDPQLTFEADISDMLMTLMPGLMFDFMTPGKRAAMAAEMAAGSEVAYRNFADTVLRTAAEVRRAWIELAYAREAGGLYQSAISNLQQNLALSNARYATAGMMASLEPQVRLQNQIAEHHSHHLAVADRLAAARARFKAALGLLPSDPDPAWPDVPLTVTPIPPEEELWRRTLAANPELARMRAMVEMAVAGVEVAHKSRTPDFSLGLMADLKADPLMFRPTATLTLPVWREKIAAAIAAAEARRAAAAARVTAEQLTMAAGFARMLSMVREADRMLAYIDATALPNLARMSATAEAGYQSGAGEAGMITEARHMATLMRLERLAALREREDAVTDLLLMTADILPADHPLLSQPAPASN